MARRTQASMLAWLSAETESSPFHDCWNRIPPQWAGSSDDGLRLAKPVVTARRRAAALRLHPGTVLSFGLGSRILTANACLEIETSRAIAAQLIRHRSFSFQEFSQRYARVEGIEPVSPRRQDTRNRQNSVDDLPKDVKDWWAKGCERVIGESRRLYDEAIARGIAKESARMVLPMASRTRLYMNGTIRSWIHYIALRTTEGTQKEHRDIALAARDILVAELPLIARAVGWKAA